MYSLTVKKSKSACSYKKTRVLVTKTQKYVTVMFLEKVYVKEQSFVFFDLFLKLKCTNCCRDCSGFLSMFLLQ